MFLFKGSNQHGSTLRLQEVGSNDLKLTLDSRELSSAEGRGGQLGSNATSHSLISG